jgi:leader peptidase (prepilin peptidase) / N-methyltransferase
MTNILHLLSENPSYLYLIVGILGLLVGSFLNVVIYRLPKMLQQDWKEQCSLILEQEPPELEKVTLSTPNSTCPHCGHAIKPWENIPIVSYLFLRGKCSACRASISIRYPIIEAVTGVLSLAVAYKFGASYATLSTLALTWSLIALTMIDADTQLLPDNITLPLLWLGLIANYFGTLTDFSSAFWGAIFGYLALWSVYWAFKLLTGKEGMGYGDFKLLAALGAWLGWQMLPIIILLSSVVGAIIGIGMILIRGKDKNVPMPFGPYLAIAGWIALVWGDAIKAIWLG